jgi:IS30 family transposase
MHKRLSAETIYAALYVLPRGTLLSELLAALRQARGQIPNMTPMAERPAEIVPRTVPGHWEGDLIKGARNGSAVCTMVEAPHTWCSWLGWTGRMHGVPVRVSRRNFGTCPRRCAKP